MGIVCSVIADCFAAIGRLLSGLVGLIASCLESIVGLITALFVGIFDILACIFCCGRGRKGRGGRSAV